MSLTRREPLSTTFTVAEPVLLYGETPADCGETRSELATSDDEADAQPRKFTPGERAAITARLRPKKRERRVDALSVLLGMRDEGV